MTVMVTTPGLTSALRALSSSAGRT